MASSRIDTSDCVHRIRSPHEFAGASAGRERRKVAGVERMEPKPIVPSPDYLAVVGIVRATHGIAFLEGSAVGRMVICRSGCVTQCSRRHCPIPASSVKKRYGASAGRTLAHLCATSTDASRMAPNVEIGLLRAPPIGRVSRQSAHGDQPKADRKSVV